jgi:hypothetical protein
MGEPEPNVESGHVYAKATVECDSTLTSLEVNMKEGREKGHVRGVGAKEQRQYEHIKESAEKSGRYGGRAKEVAARTVLKEHRAKGHKKGH